MQSLALAKQEWVNLLKKGLPGLLFPFYNIPPDTEGTGIVPGGVAQPCAPRAAPASSSPTLGFLVLGSRGGWCEPRPGSSVWSGPHEDAGAERRSQPLSPPTATSRRHRSLEPRPRRPHSPLPAARNPQRGVRNPERTARSTEPGTHSPQHRARNAQPATPSRAPPRGRLARAPLFQNDYESPANFVGIRVHRATRRRRRRGWRARRIPARLGEEHAPPRLRMLSAGPALRRQGRSGLGFHSLRPWYPRRQR